MVKETHMLRIDKVEIFPGAESVTVYGDDEMINKYSLVPNIPRFRLNDRRYRWSGPDNQVALLF